MSSVYADRLAELEGLLEHLETRLARLTRGVSRAPAQGTVERAGDVVAGLLTEIAERLRGRKRADRWPAAISDDVLKFGSDALRRVTREAEQRPLVILAVAVGVGAIAAGLFARRV